MESQHSTLHNSLRIIKPVITYNQSVIWILAPSATLAPERIIKTSLSQA